MAREVGFEPTTTGLEDRCSIQLSYSRKIKISQADLTFYSNFNLILYDSFDFAMTKDFSEG